MLYQEPRPYWIGPETAEKNGVAIPLAGETRIKMVLTAPGYGNPGADGMAAGVFTAFLTYHAKYYGFTFGACWTILMSLSNLTSGITSVNQILFGLQLGVWLSCTLFYIFDFD